MESRRALLVEDTAAGLKLLLSEGTLRFNSDMLLIETLFSLPLLAREIGAVVGETC